MSPTSTTHPSNEAATRGLVSLKGPEDGAVAAEFKRAVVYLRVSTVEQAETTTTGDGFSIPAQREAAFRKAKELGAEVVDEYVDRGESAKTADRPALQILMHRLQTMSDVDYVIVHKVDRLARNRADDANLTLAIYKYGAKLVSCTEQIDDTPSGKLVHGIMATINEWYSANLATEASKGMLQKAKQGGTPGRAPVGYKNVIEGLSGRSARIVVVDEEAAPHVQWAFSAFALGDLSLADLTDALADRGLKTLPAKSRPGGPLHKSKVAKMLRNRYYLGLVIFKEVEYPGNHPALVDQEVFDAVGAILDERATAREKLRKHRHYLAGSLFCARCSRRLCFTLATGKGGGKYDYYFCTGRRDGSCDQPMLRVPEIETAIEDLYRRVRLPAEFVDAVQAQIREQVTADQADLDRQLRKHRGKRKSLEDSHQRLLDAYIEGLVSMEEFKSQQAQLKRQLAAVDSATSTARIRWEDLSDTLAIALSVAHECGQIYAAGAPTVRRLFNQGLFTRILVDADDVATGEPTGLFQALLGVENPQNAGETHSDHGRLTAYRCLNESLVVRPGGFEPPTCG